jgi:hypothetical protein
MKKIDWLYVQFESISMEPSPLYYANNLQAYGLFELSAFNRKEEARGPIVKAVAKEDAVFLLPY